MGMTMIALSGGPHGGAGILVWGRRACNHYERMGEGLVDGCLGEVYAAFWQAALGAGEESLELRERALVNSPWRNDVQAYEQ